MSSLWGFDALDAEELFPAKSGGEGPCLETRIVTPLPKVGEVVDNLMSNELLQGWMTRRRIGKTIRSTVTS